MVLIFWCHLFPLPGLWDQFLGCRMFEELLVLKFDLILLSQFLGCWIFEGLPALGFDVMYSPCPEDHFWVIGFIFRFSFSDRWRKVSQPSILVLIWFSCPWWLVHSSSKSPSKWPSALYIVSWFFIFLLSKCLVSHWLRANIGFYFWLSSVAHILLSLCHLLIVFILQLGLPQHHPIGQRFILFLVVVLLNWVRTRQRVFLWWMARRGIQGIRFLISCTHKHRSIVVIRFWIFRTNTKTIHKFFIWFRPMSSYARW